MPPALALILATLLAKDPERRYFSLEGLEEDLSRGRLEPAGFELRESERATSFAVPAYLYGREEARERLLGALPRARQGRELLLVTGPAGTGKSTLARERGRGNPVGGGPSRAGARRSAAGVAGRWRTARPVWHPGASGCAGARCSRAWYRSWAFCSASSPKRRS